MAKVFAVTKTRNAYELVTWNSKAAFEKYDSWIDDKWLMIATSDDFKLGHFVEPYENHKPQKGGFAIVYNDDLIAASEVMAEAAVAYLKKNKKWGVDGINRD